MAVKGTVIISVSPGRVELSAVSDGSRRRIQGLFTAQWTDATITEVISQAVKKFSVKRARLLLDDELAYVMKVKIPAKSAQGDERGAFFREAQKYIPETLQDKDWDYRVTRRDKENTEALVFAPVLRIFTLIGQALPHSSVEIEAVEPVSIARTRNPDPVVGLALKTDLTGQDDATLNVPLPEVAPPPGARPGKFGSRRTLWLNFIAAILAVVFISFCLWIIQRILL